jgi:acyl carrier protein
MSVEAKVVIQLVAAQLGISSVHESDRIVEDLGAESMDIVNIIAVVEERYAISFDEAELPDISTVGDLIALAARLAA